MAVRILNLEEGKSTILTGNTTEDFPLKPDYNRTLVVKGMLIHGSGNVGKSTIETTEGKVLLVLYHSAQSKISPSGRNNLKLNKGEEIFFRTVNRGPTDETFFGVSVEYKGTKE